jgi:predicted transcriptional regulator
MERSTVHLLHKRGKSLREIAGELGRSKTTIARALSEAVDRQPSTRRRWSSVDPFRGQIGEWLQQGLSGGTPTGSTKRQLAHRTEDVHFKLAAPGSIRQRPVFTRIRMPILSRCTLVTRCRGSSSQ